MRSVNFFDLSVLYLISTLSVARIQSARFVQVGLASGRVQTGVAALAEISHLFVCWLVNKFFFSSTHIDVYHLNVSLHNTTPKYIILYFKYRTHLIAERKKASSNDKHISTHFRAFITTQHGISLRNFYIEMENHSAERIN